MAQPVTPPADDKDWTWVLQRPCTQCGFEAGTLPLELVPTTVERASGQLIDALGRDDARVRPTPDTWSPLEYACHVRDVHGVMTRRLRLIQQGRGEPVHFDNWDQDAAAVEARYWEQDPGHVADELRTALVLAMEAWSSVPEEQAGWRGVRSGSGFFTITTLGQYYAHDVVHHAWDVRAEA